jgi:hypothetical protein
MFGIVSILDVDRQRLQIRRAVHGIEKAARELVADSRMRS